MQETESDTNLEEIKSEFNFEIIDKEEAFDNINTKGNSEYIINAEYMQNMKQIQDQNKDLQERLILVEGICNSNLCLEKLASKDEVIESLKDEICEKSEKT